MQVVGQAVPFLFNTRVVSGADANIWTARRAWPKKMLTYRTASYSAQGFNWWAWIRVQWAAHHHTARTSPLPGRKGRPLAANTGFASSRTLILLRLESQP